MCRRYTLYYEKVYVEHKFILFLSVTFDSKVNNNLLNFFSVYEICHTLVWINCNISHQSTFMFNVWLLTKNLGGSGARGDANFVINSKTIRISVIKKPASEDRLVIQQKWRSYQ
jgi:hypothetical protein